MFLNCSNLSKYSELKMEVVDRQFKVLDGYSLADCEAVQKDGFRLPVKWKANDRVKSKDPVRLRVQWGGVRFEDPVVYAVYVAP